MSNNLSELALAEIIAANPDLARRNGARLARTALGGATAQGGAPKPARARKYRNEPVVLNGLKFDSKKEGRRYVELVLLAKAGEITDLECHPKYEFVHNGIKIGSFRPDFRYYDSNDQLVIEDTKSPSTKKETAYRLRKRLLLAFHGLEVKEV